ncbi:hypothetical protein [Bacillus phage BC-T25]|nr:hypothetical protein [Bacillus phage BC-T25]
MSPQELKKGDKFTFRGNLFQVHGVRDDVLIVATIGFAYAVELIEE